MAPFLIILLIVFIILWIKIRQIEDRLYVLQKFTTKNSTELSNIRYSYNEKMKHEKKGCNL